MIKDDIELNLKNNLEIYFLEVINESNMHNTPDGAESHFKITVVSDFFEEMRAVQRHQKYTKFCRKNEEKFMPSRSSIYTQRVERYFRR